MDQTEVVPGSEEYNQLMAEKFNNPGTEEDVEQDIVPVPDMPAEGVDKYYDNETGAYNWEAHARELLLMQTDDKKTKKKKLKLPKKPQKNQVQRPKNKKYQTFLSKLD